MTYKLTLMGSNLESETGSNHERIHDVLSVLGLINSEGSEEAKDDNKMVRVSF